MLAETEQLSVSVQQLIDVIPAFGQRDTEVAAIVGHCKGNCFVFESEEALNNFFQKNVYITQIIVVNKVIHIISHCLRTAFDVKCNREILPLYLSILLIRSYF